MAKKNNLCLPFSFSAHCNVIIIRTDGQTDVTKLIVAFRDFVNAPLSTGYELDLCLTVHHQCR